MSYKYIVLMSLLFLINGCERGVGEEPITVNNVNDNNLTGTWVLSKTYTDKKYLEYLKIKVDDYYFTIKNNTKLDYHSFNPKNNRKILEAKGKWKLLGTSLKLSKFNIGTIYISSDGWHSANPNSSVLKKPITTKTIKGFKHIQTFRITKKNNKLLLWYYEGDPDARRYIMYEKKSK